MSTRYSWKPLTCALHLNISSRLMCVTCLFLSLFPAPPLPCFPSLSRVVLPVSVEEVSDIYRDITQDYL